MESTRRKISFIITSRNEPLEMANRTLFELLSTAEGHAFEIIVIDDGSTVPFASVHPCVHVTRNDTPLGVSPARRKGAEIASGDVLVWLDAHMRFAPGWLEQMLAHVDSGSLLCSAFWDYNLQVCHCWGADYTWCAERDYAKQRYPGFALRHRVAAPQEPVADVPMAIGACYMMGRESYEKIGGFSPLFRVWGIDEQDISARAWIHGVGVKCVTGARVGHFSRTTFPYPVQFEHLEFNQLVMIRSVFEETTVERLERFFKPIPTIVDEWLTQVDIAGWRGVVQDGRRSTDEELFARLCLCI